MEDVVYVNGEFLPKGEAKISVFDRGFLFADGIYEVSSVLDGKPIDNAAHIARMHRSLDELQMSSPVTDDELLEIQAELIQRNALTEGVVYWQITRGAADRDFNFPADATPSLVMFSQVKNLSDAPAARTGVSVVSQPDIRWARRDIKTVQLLAPSLAKQAAKDAGAGDAWMVQDGYVTEGTSNNAYIVTKDGVIVTRNLSTDILHGITRAAVLRMAAEAQMTIEERPFTIEEAQNAAEAFFTSASSFVTPVVKIDGVALGDGAPGPIATRLREIYIAEARAQAG